jgi:hypothetical protein
MTELTPETTKPSTETPLPRSVRRGPQITLKCKCGESTYVRYGEQWTCPKCRRHWNTRRIPMEQYVEIRKTQLRYRRIPIIMSAISLLCVIAFIIVGRPLAGLLVVGLLATTWSMFFRPIHRRRYREAIAKLPSWEIEPD